MTLLPASEPEVVAEPSEPVVVVEDVWVRFRTTHEKNQTLKRTLTRKGGPSKSSRTIEALRGVSFEVAAGSVYGVIGHNGAGKTTLFRTIAGILPPNEGRVVTWGHITPLLSLGLGFNRELTGRENILLGGLASGLGPDQIAAQYYEIVTFADLGPAIDYPMRSYSSGMFARLGFAIAAHLQPEILLVDEALSAGDATFKAKTMQKIADLCTAQDSTVLLVSHGMEVVKLLATQCMWLHRGEVQMEGATEEVVGAYMEAAGVTDKNVEVMEDF